MGIKMKKWKVLAFDYGSAYIHNTSYVYAALFLVPPMLGIKQELVIEYVGKKWKYCAPPADFEKSGKIVLGKLKDKKFFEEVVDKSVSTANAVHDYAEKLNNLEARKLSNVELFSRYNKLYELFVQMNIWGHILNLADFEHFMLSNKILAFLEKRIKQTKMQMSAGEAFSILATPNQRSKLQQQDFDFYSLLARGKGDAGAVEQHAEKYKWLQFHYDGPIILGKDYFVEALASATKQGENGKKKVAEIAAHEKQLAQQQKQIVTQLNLNEEEQHWIEVAKALGYLKGLRKETIFEANANYYPLLVEISKRLNLTPRQVRFIAPQELEGALLHDELDVAEINKRTQHCITLQGKEGVVFLTGKKADEVAKNIYEEQADAGLTEIKGTPAFPGKVQGEVRVIILAEEMKKFKPGDILVSPATNPNLVPIMKIAGAIVTNEGGVTCHAAIVSRELKVPCVIGTKIATQWLKDGDKVEVDATNGLVRKL